MRRLLFARRTILNGFRYRVVAPSIRIVPWTALASCWPLPQQLLPVSAAGGGRRRCTLAMFSGRIILNFGISERLRAFRYPIFTGGVVEENSICSAAFCESAALQEKFLPAFSRLTRHVTIFPLRPLCVKMRLERSAERDKRKNKNNPSSDYAQSNAEGILNRFVCPQRLSAEKRQTAFSAPPPCNLCNCDNFS